ncbi:type II toxin-antitoxin system Phd/YefM family antitoxin [Kordiimonas sp.]|uniref:type II toxin-antitoxin system Phd/YefM family antitoxin n=1 Tax=Kordiimonas sp. TaxID=1970157 RepID=UPI003B52FFC3
MEIAINEAKEKLCTLIEVAASGEQVLLTKHGRPVAEIRPVAVAKKRAEGPDAAHSADFLYDTGMPV